MEFRLLGRLVVEDEGLDLTPARPKQRILLALLLLHANEPVRTDDLVEALWGERPPETAQTALHGHISALRKRLGVERIETHPPGYLLRLAEDDELDLRRFERLTGEAQAAGPLARAEKLRAALALFRGEPLADFRYEPFARNEWARLEELRLVAVERLFEAELELGRLADLVPRLERAVAEHPLRERLLAQLMLALYRTGRQADALHTFQEARRALVAELGIEPGPALRRLERQILNQEVELLGPDAARARERPRGGTMPAGVVTFLALAGTPGPDTPEHSWLVRDLVRRHGGVELQGLPEALVVAFERARDAAALATELQRLTSGSGAGARTGIHSAEAAPMEAGYSGQGARGAAAVCAAAHPGQILLSQATHDLLRERPLEDVDARDLGLHRLQDLLRPQRLFQLVAPGLESDFPPVRSLESRPTNLPLQPTALLGRGRELGDLCDLLRQPETRCVTLTGTGGTGKTRLALQVAANLLDDFDDGVYFVGLAPLADPSLVLPTAALTLGAGETGIHAVAEELASHLRSRSVLLVLDNFEHVLPAAAELAEATASAPGVKLLATSRAPLRIPGEQLYPVSPLEVPAAAAEMERLLQFDAVALFAARARAIRPEFELTVENGPAVAAICRALDGLPLAIELAATRVGVLPPAALLGRLEGRLQLLKGRPRDAPERHRTLRRTIDWSHDLLEPDEQRLFAQLSVFAGGCTVETAESVCAGGLDVVDGLTALVEASLVRVEGTDAEPRFAMLETIREYAAERLAESGEADDLRHRHAACFLQLAEEAEAHLRGSPGSWLERLEAEHDNMRAALDWLEAAREPELQLRLAGALWRFWYLRGHLGEGLRRIEAALREDGRPTSGRARALIGGAVLALNTGDAAAARGRAEEALALHRRLGDPWGEAYALFMLGNALDDRRAAHRTLEQSVTAFLAVGDEHSALLARRSLAWACSELGDAAGAQALHEENLERARATANARIEASTLGELAESAVAEGRMDEAASMLHGSLRLHREHGDVLDAAVDLCRVARVLALEGRAAAAAQLLAHVDGLGDTVGVRRSRIAALSDDALAAVRSRLDEAALADEWEHGRRLTADDAVALALESL